jgi:integrase
VAHLRRLPSGRWQATIRAPDGRRVSRSDPLRRVVADWARDEEARIARGQWRDSRTARVTFEAWRDRWLAARVVAPETRRADESTLRLHVSPHWSGWLLPQISRLDVQAWVRRLQQEEVGAHAVRRAHNLLASMLGAAVLEGILAQSPCQRIALPPTPPKAPAWFTCEQVDALVEQLPRRHGIATELMVWTGLRWGEMAGLRVGDVDWLRQRVSVVGAVTQAGQWKEYPKTSKSRREVPAPGHVLDLLATLVEGRAGEALLFTTERGGRPWSGANWRGVWDRAVAAAGVPAHSPHVCRHTAASWLVQDGVPLYDVQRLLGHESFATTQIYAHLAPDAHGVVESAWSRRLLTHQRRTGDPNTR